MYLLQAVVEACDPANTPSIIFDASSSSDPSGRPITTLTWGQEGVINPALDEAITAVNAKPDFATKRQLVLTGTAIAQLTDGLYTIVVKATNFLGRSATARLTFTKQPSGTAPMVTIVGGSEQSFKLSEGLSINSLLQAKSVCTGKTVEFAWTALDGFPVPLGYAQKNLVLKPPINADAGQSYTVRLTARFKGNIEAATADVSVSLSRILTSS